MKNMNQLLLKLRPTKEKVRNLIFRREGEKQCQQFQGILFRYSGRSTGGGKGARVIYPPKSIKKTHVVVDNLLLISACQSKKFVMYPPPPQKKKKFVSWTPPCANDSGVSRYCLSYVSSFQYSENKFSVNNEATVFF